MLKCYQILYAFIYLFLTIVSFSAKCWVLLEGEEFFKINKTNGGGVEDRLGSAGCDTTDGACTGKSKIIKLGTDYTDYIINYSWFFCLDSC